MASPVLQFKRGNIGAASTVPALRPGEPAFTLDKFDLFVGFNTTVSGNKFFGSHRYWGREDGTTSLRLKLVDKTGIGGTIQLKAPDDQSGTVTYVFPGTQGSASSVLTNDGSGNLSWSSGSSSPIFTGISTFTDTTDNTLGNADTGAVQIDGGLGVNKNVTIGAGLSVSGQSHFIGTATFYGGTINLGDSVNDIVNIDGRIDSHLVPSIDATYDVGIGTLRWRNAAFSGIVTATTFNGNASSSDQVKTITASDNAGTYYVTFVDSHNGSATNETVYTDDGIYYNPGTNTFTTQHATFTGNVNVQGTLTGTATTATRATLVDTTGTSDNNTYYATFVDTSGGQTGETLRVGSALSLNASSGNVKAAGDLIAGSGYLASSNGTRAMYMYDTSGDVSFQGKVVADNYRSSSNASNTLTFSGLDATFASNLTVSGNLYVNGSTTQVNTTALTIEDRTIDLGIVNGVAPASTTTWDLGVLFNYYTSGAAKKSAVIWEQADSRFKFASVLASDTDGTTVDTPQLTVTTFAPIEVAELWINNTCTGGSQQVIGCVGSELQLQSITIDCGTF